MAKKWFVKLPYYLRTLVELQRIATTQSVGGCLIGRNRRLQFRDGWTLELSNLLDLLVVKETLCDDVYGLSDLCDTGVVVDVGAGVGDFTVAAARRSPDLLVVAFEPSPVAFALLRRNVSAGGHANVRLTQAAIGTRNGYLLRAIGSGPRASAASARRDDAAVAVDGIRLDDAVPDGAIRLLKIDCEGMELDALESARGVMDRVERTVIEFHRHLLPDADARVLGFLHSMGFTTRRRVDPYDDNIGLISATRLE